MESDAGGQHCSRHFLVSSLSGFSEKSCPVSVFCPDSVRILSVFSVRCLSFRILSVSILTGVRILSGFPAGQGRDRDVRSVGVLVRSLDGIKKIIIQVKVFVAFNCSL